MTAMLGAAIRSFRLRRRQFHNGKPWSLTDLAAALDTDKAYLSRVERGATQPTRTTLARIAQALELTRAEAQYLLRLGGFAPQLGTPGPEAAAAAIRWLAKQSRAYANPLSLYSVDTRLWYANALWLRLVGLSPMQFRTCMQGREFLLNQWSERSGARCIASTLIGSRYRERADLGLRLVARFRAAVLEGHLPEESAHALLQNPKLRELWDATEARMPDTSLAGEQHRSEVEYPGRGLLCFDTWWCQLQVDHRFVVVLYLPHDLHTREALVAIRREPRPADAGACALHGTTCYGDRLHTRLRQAP